MWFPNLWTKNNPTQVDNQLIRFEYFILKPEIIEILT